MMVEKNCLHLSLEIYFTGLVWKEGKQLPFFFFRNACFPVFILLYTTTPRRQSATDLCYG